ncbi:hypothetical protein B0H14DRAFT_2624590 [Mycena olivaceomarginata]|nr:hypothetical protein B0H14DRAFT_2624590 [Mycena olivaceomarginata]
MQTPHTFPSSQFITPSSSEAPLLLCRVSSLWRTIAINDPSLWRSLSTETIQHPQLVERWLDRAANLTLSLHMARPLCAESHLALWGSVGGEEETLTSFTPVAKIVLCSPRAKYPPTRKDEEPLSDESSRLPVNQWPNTFGHFCRSFCQIQMAGWGGKALDGAAKTGREPLDDHPLRMVDKYWILDGGADENTELEYSSLAQIRIATGGDREKSPDVCHEKIDAGIRRLAEWRCSAPEARSSDVACLSDEKQKFASEAVESPVNRMCILRVGRTSTSSRDPHPYLPAHERVHARLEVQPKEDRGRREFPVVPPVELACVVEVAACEWEGVVVMEEGLISPQVAQKISLHTASNFLGE